MSNIIYPTIKESSKLTIGVTAPSSGLGNEAFIRRFELIKKQFKHSGIEVIEGKCLRKNNQYVSDIKENRVKDFMKLWNDPNIDLIFPPWGGENLIDCLELIDFKSLKASPTWMQGYSDISTLLFAITTVSGIATAHGTNLLDSIEGQDQLTRESRKYLIIKSGESFIQKSSEKWQLQFINFKDKLDTKFDLTEKTNWKILNGDHVKCNGRIIGGCIDTLKNLIGTPYGDLERFSKDYCLKEGMIIYLENCELKPTDFYRTLWNMKYAGWFKNINGVILGRSSGPEDQNFSYIDSLNEFFSQFKFPVIYDADIGHKPPQMTLINGSFATVECRNGKGLIAQSFI